MDAYLTKYKLTRVTPQLAVLSWHVVAATADHRVAIYYGPSEEGPWVFLAEAETGSNMFTLDISTPGYALRFFVLRLLSVSGGGYFDTGPFTVEHELDHIAAEMIRKKEVFLRTKSGVPMAVLHRKRWGPTCPSCWDQGRKVSTDAGCRICYGTGYVDGYGTPIRILGLMNPYTEVLGREHAPVREENTNFEFGPYPDITPDDVVIDLVQNIRYRVFRNHPSLHRGAQCLS